MFPARHNLLMTEAIAHHVEPAPAWDLTAPAPDVLQAWLIGAVGKGAPLPGSVSAVSVIGARRLDILDRGAAMIRLRIGGDEVTYLVQRARGIAPEGAERTDGSLRAVAWNQGRFTIVGVGPDATAASWRAALR
jgi:hypothetical protein